VSNACFINLDGINAVSRDACITQGQKLQYNHVLLGTAATKGYPHIVQSREHLQVCIQYHSQHTMTSVDLSDAQMCYTYKTLNACKSACDVRIQLTSLKATLFALLREVCCRPASLAGLGPASLLLYEAAVPGREAAVPGREPADPGRPYEPPLACVARPPYVAHLS